MTLEQFIATERRMTRNEYCEAFGVDTAEIIGPYVLTYRLGDWDGLYIEDRGEAHTAANLHGGRYYLILERDDWLSDDLPDLQRKLFEFAAPGDGA